MHGKDVGGRSVGHEESPELGSVEVVPAAAQQCEELGLTRPRRELREPFDQPRRVDDLQDAVGAQVPMAACRDVCESDVFEESKVPATVLFVIAIQEAADQFLERDFFYCAPGAVDRQTTGEELVQHEDFELESDRELDIRQRLQVENLRLRGESFHDASMVGVGLNLLGGGGESGVVQISSFGSAARATQRYSGLKT